MGPENNGLAHDDLDEGSPLPRMRYQEAFEFAPDAQFITDELGTVVEANHAASNLLASSKEFLIGKPLPLFSAPGYHLRFYEAIRRLRIRTTSEAFETRIGRHRGEWRTVRVMGWMGAWGAGTVDRFMHWVAWDLTDQRRAETQRDGLLRQLATAGEEERRQLSRDLHDHVGQTLTAIVLEVQAAQRAAELPPAAIQRLDRVQQLADELGRQLHDLAAQLRPTVLDDLGLEVAVQQCVADWSERTGLKADFQATGLRSSRLPPDLETVLYRVVQEALTNVAKHAKATRVSVVVAHRDGHAVAVIEDDGCGFDPDMAREKNGRLGLIGMHERVTLAGGTLEIESRPGQGTTIYARVPL